MDTVTSVLDFFSSPLFGGIAAGLLVISEALASIPAVKANSIFQLMQHLLQSVTEKKTP